MLNSGTDETLVLYWITSYIIVFFPHLQNLLVEMNIGLIEKKIIETCRSKNMWVKKHSVVHDS